MTPIHATIPFWVFLHRTTAELAGHLRWPIAAKIATAWVDEMLLLDLEWE